MVEAPHTRYKLLLQFCELELEIRNFDRLLRYHLVVYGLEGTLVFDGQRHNGLDKPVDERGLIAYSLRLSENSEYT